MALRPPREGITERICNYGVAGVGKSYDFYTIVKRSMKSKSDARFFVIDTDESAPVMLSDSEAGFADIPAAFAGDGGDDETLCFVESVYDWDSMASAFERFQGKMVHGKFVDGMMGPNDWLFVDMLSPAWQWAQDYYTHQVFGKGLTEFFLTERVRMQNTSAKKNEVGLTGEKDWSIINAIYGDVATRILRSPGNVFVTCEQKAIPKDADRVTRTDFGPIGCIPAGQKKTPHLFHSCFHKTVRQNGDYEITSAKNRSRPKLENVVIKDFALEVLVRNRGWKL